MIRKTAVLLCALIFALPAFAMDAEKQAAHEKRLEELYQQHSTFIKENINDILSDYHEVTKIERMKTEKYEPRLYEVSFNEGDSVVMRFLPDYDEKRKQAEIDAMKAAHIACSGPEVLAANAGCGNLSYAIMEKVKTIPATQVPWDKADTYKAFGLLLDALHTKKFTVESDPSQFLYRQVPSYIKHITDKWALLGNPGIPGLFEKIQACMDAAEKVLTPFKGKEVLVHGNLHAGNLLFTELEDEDEDEYLDIQVVDWERVGQARDPMIDVAMVREMYVSKEWHETFMEEYEANGYSDIQKICLDLVCVVTSCWLGLAYTKVDPGYFAQRYPEIERQAQAGELRVGQAVRNITHNGFKRETTKDYAEFGSLLLYKGVKHIDRGDHQRWIGLLKAAEEKRVSDEIIKEKEKEEEDCRVM